MNTNPTSSSGDNDRLEDLAVSMGLNCIDETDAKTLSNCHECPVGKAVLTQFDEATAMLTASQFPPIEPPSSVKDAIFARISDEDNEEQGYHLVKSAEGDWKTLPGGKIRIKTLSDIAEIGHTMAIIDAKPGAVFMPHAHEGVEEVYLLSGDLETVGQTLGPGDYLRHEAGTHHPKAVTHTGCQALLVTARENHPRKTISAYSELVSILKGLKGKK